MTLSRLRQEETRAKEELYTVALEMGRRISFREGKEKQRDPLVILAELVEWSCTAYRYHRLVLAEMQREREAELAMLMTFDSDCE